MDIDTFESFVRNPFGFVHIQPLQEHEEDSRVFLKELIENVILNERDVLHGFSGSETQLAIGVTHLFNCLRYKCTLHMVNSAFVISLKTATPKSGETFTVIDREGIHKQNHPLPCIIKTTPPCWFHQMMVSEEELFATDVLAFTEGEQRYSALDGSVITDECYFSKWFYTALVVRWFREIVTL
ncbi:hypothetical protein ACPV5O_26505 [Vibrio maritimus]|uniref:hypothetical protein n=1 Tax=Vibrio maritimus TaxID=990268 RepID=UPI004069654E